MARLEIAVHDPVRWFQRDADLREHLGRVAERQRADAGACVGELLALEQLHHQEGAPLASSTPTVTISTT